MKSLLLLFCKFFAVSGLSCDEILELSEDTIISLETLKTLQPKETVQCLSNLGKEKMPQAETDFIWQSIITFFGDISKIPDKVLMQLHWVTPALTPDDYLNLTLSDIDVIQNFGLNYGLAECQLAAIADRVREDFAGKEPEDYTYYDLNALRQILCAFNQSEIERIHPSAYREAAVIIGRLDNCKAEVMQGFATLASHPRAFGVPSSWSHSTIKVLGKVADFLPKEITNNFL